MRGNIFSFLLPWEHVLRQLLFEKVEDGDLSQWPLHPDGVRSVVRVRVVRGSETLVDKFRDLYVRSAVVKKLATIYIDRKVKDLAGRKGVLDIHTLEQCKSVAEALKAHANRRVDTYYPPSEHGSESGGLLPGVRELIREQLGAGDYGANAGRETAFDQNSEHHA